MMHACGLVRYSAQAAQIGENGVGRVSPAKGGVLQALVVRFQDGNSWPVEVPRYYGYWTPGYFRRSEGCFKGPLPRHLPEAASRIPTQGSKGNGDSGRLVPRAHAGEQALQRDTPLKTESFARKGHASDPSDPCLSLSQAARDAIGSALLHLSEGAERRRRRERVRTTVKADAKRSRGMPRCVLVTRRGHLVS